MTRSVVVGTAGHIDHGKSALVKALTGTDPDRLKEEQARGITIDLGFAHARVGDVEIAFVDVPGHERFVRNMLAGAGGIDAVLLVIAADESVMPQTREHFEICRLLGIPRGLVVITKSDLADEDTIELVRLDVAALVAGSALEHAPVIPVSARTGAGLDPLRDALASLAGGDARLGRSDVTRLPIDRAFTMKGFGTVVTGTLVSGTIAEGQELAVEPDAGHVRVRGVQVHGRATASASAPRRVAVNVAGPSASELARGHSLATPGVLTVTSRLDARIAIVAGARPLRHGARVRLHQGTSESIARVALCAVRDRPDAAWRQAAVGEASAAAPEGATAYVRLRLPTPVAITRRDRIVLRTLSPAATVAGGVVLDPSPPSAGLRRPATFDRFVAIEIDTRDDAQTQDAVPSAFVAVWIREAGAHGLAVPDLVARGGLDPAAAAATVTALTTAGTAIAADDRLFDVAVSRAIADQVVAVVSAYHRAHPEDEGMPREAVRMRVASRAPVALFDRIIEDLARRQALKGTDRLALSAHRPVASATGQAADRVLTLLRHAGLAPPEPAALAAAAGLPVADLDRLLARLGRERQVIFLGTLVFHPEPLATLRADVRALAAGATAAQPARVDVQTFKQRYGVSRKFAIPLLEWLDRERVTRRAGDSRIVIG